MKMTRIIVTHNVDKQLLCIVIFRDINLNRLNFIDAFR